MFFCLFPDIKYNYAQDLARTPGIRSFFMNAHKMPFRTQRHNRGAGCSDLCLRNDPAHTRSALSRTGSSKLPDVRYRQGVSGELAFRTAPDRTKSLTPCSDQGASGELTFRAAPDRTKDPNALLQSRRVRRANALHRTQSSEKPYTLLRSRRVRRANVSRRL